MAPLRLLLIVHLLAGSLQLLNANSFNDDSTEVGLSFDREPQDVVVVGRNQSARLDCLVRNQQSSSSKKDAFTVVWFQDGFPLLLPDQRRQLLPNGSLLFDKVLQKRSGRINSDEGVYHCMAQSTNPASGSFISANASVRTAVLGRDFTSWPTDVTTEVGDVARFECQIDSVPEAAILWEKDGVPIVPSTSPRFVSVKPGVLHIYNVKVDDSGHYRCVASNGLAGKDRRSPAGRLLVTPPNPEQPIQPHFVSPPVTESPLWIRQGESAVLECLVSAHPPSPPVVWSLNGTAAVSHPENPGYLEVSQAGDYKCSVDLPDSAAGDLSRIVPVRLALSPVIIRRPKSQVFPTAKTVRFECEVSGSPPPDIRWLKDGQAIPIVGRIKNRLRNGGTLSELVLSNTVTTDSGIYQCWASNRAGHASAAARLLVNMSEGTRPEPPSNLRILSVSPTEAFLMWDPPANVPVDDVKAYTVHYMPLGGDELQEVAVNASHLFENLKPGVKYSMYVRAYLRKAASDPSEKLLFDPSAPALVPIPPSSSPSFPSSATTPVVVQPRPPPRTLSPPGQSSSSAASMAGPNVTLQAVSPTQLKVSWRKFSAFGSGPVSMYRIEYRRHRAKESDTEVVKGDVYEYTIMGLHPGRKYDVRVVPGSMISAAGPWFTKEMPRVMTSDAPSLVSSTPHEQTSSPAPAIELVAHEFNGSSSVLVSWEDVGSLSGRPAADGVRLRYRQQGSRESSPVLVLPPSGSQWITQLRPATVYEFQLSASIEDREGPVSQASIRTLPDPDLDDQDDESFNVGNPIGAESQAMSSSAIKLSWHFQPASGSILYYTVRYVSVPEEALPGMGPSLPPVIRYIRTTASHVHLTNLTAYTLYRMSIKCHDRDGRSSPFSSPPVEGRTLADLPTSPLNPSWQALADGSVQVSWRPPLHPNGIITGYVVLVSTDPSAPVDTWTRHTESGSRLRTQLTGLPLGTPQYYFRIQGRTSAGWGAMTEPLAGLMHHHPTESSSLPPPPYSSESPDSPPSSEQFLGVIIGLAVGLGFALICAIAMLWRSRCTKGLSPERIAAIQMGGGGGGPDRAAGAGMNGIVVCNGNGYQHHSAITKPSSRPNGMRHFGRTPTSRDQQRSSLVEMEAFVPMLTTIPDDLPAHLDTKGGYLTGSHRISRRDDSLSNGSIRAVMTSRSEGEGPGSNETAPSDSTLLSQATETTCLGLDYAGRNRRRRRRSSHDSSLHSLGSESSHSSSGSGCRSLRGQDDNDTGICHADHQLNDSDPAAGGSSIRASSRDSRELVA